MLGVFDSGLGGLSSVKALSQYLPREDLVYFGDTGRVPYGTRSAQIITRYALQDVRFLMQFSPKALLVACGTVSSVALEVLREHFDLPIVGVIDGAVRAAVQATRNKKIVVLGTPATIRTGAYVRGLHALDDTLEVLGLACPLFVPIVEAGHISPDDPITQAVVAHYMKEIMAFGADTVILGCTHYPLLKQAIGNAVGDTVHLIDAGKESALALTEIVKKHHLLSNSAGRQQFFVSDAPADFADTARIFLHRDIGEDVKQIDIERY